jgi:hypothetical protein
VKPVTEIDVGKPGDGYKCSRKQIMFSYSSWVRTSKRCQMSNLESATKLPSTITAGNVKKNMFPNVLQALEKKEL